MKTQSFFPYLSNNVPFKAWEILRTTIEANEAGDYLDNSNLPQCEIILLKNYSYHKYLELKLDSEVIIFLPSVIPCKYYKKTSSGHPLHFLIKF